MQLPPDIRTQEIHTLKEGQTVYLDGTMTNPYTVDGHENEHALLTGAKGDKLALSWYAEVVVG